MDGDIRVAPNRSQCQCADCGFTFALSQSITFTLSDWYPIPHNVNVQIETHSQFRTVTISNFITSTLSDWCQIAQNFRPHIRLWILHHCYIFIKSFPTRSTKKVAHKLNMQLVDWLPLQCTATFLLSLLSARSWFKGAVAILEPYSFRSKISNSWDFSVFFVHSYIYRKLLVDALNCQQQCWPQYWAEWMYFTGSLGGLLGWVVTLASAQGSGGIPMWIVCALASGMWIKR